MAKRSRSEKGLPLQSQNPTVDEPTRIRLNQILQEFKNSNEKEYKFDATLSKNERALVHQISQKMGMKSKSSGTAKQRQISVFKTVHKVDADTGLENLPYFAFSEEAQAVLGVLYAHHPPGDGQLVEEMDRRHNDKTDKTRQIKDDTFSKPSMSKAEISEKLEAFSSRMNKTPAKRKITAQRSKLPIAAFKDVITSTVESHQVVLISGETGCGKTTQVPQYILDHAWGKGEACKIVCTQPRRISAMSVAERIASERGETIGENIGYKIRLESKGGKNSSVVLCTTGILLRVLCSFSKCLSRSNTGTMKNNEFEITHIIMDEIHERDRYSDFMMAVVRDMLPSHPHLRLILMSATIDAERFSQYFGGCPVILVPGFTHPVRTFYLEDVLSIVKYKKENHLDNALLNNVTDNNDLSKDDKVSLDEAIHLAWSNDDCDPLLELVTSKGSPKIFNYQHSLTGLTPLMVFAGKGRVGDMCVLLSFGADCHLRSKAGVTALEIAEQENQRETAEILKKHRDSASSNSMEGQKLLDKYLTTVNPEIVDVVLIEQLIRKICMDSKDGGILVFLPGWDEINRTRERLLQSPFFNNSRFTIMSLHSMVPAKEQKKVFLHPPPGCRKIVLSTNIAETAITIDDIVYVIDTGRMKEKSYDPYSNVQTLQSSWVSKASAKQREGRAGRCQPGICYHLYSKYRAASLPDFQVPELRRMPIEELCLQVKMIDPSCKLEEYLSKTLDPPVFESIRNAVAALQDIGALSIDEELTELGEKLGSLPVHPLTCKLIFFAILMNCLDPALTLACASDYRDPFTIPLSLGEKRLAADAKAELASLYGGYGDQLAVIAAFECWHNARTMGLESWFSSQYFVSLTTMHMLHGMRRQLQTELIRSGLIQGDVSRYNVNSHNPGILHAVLVAGLYPMVGTLITPKGAKRVVVETASGHKVRLHQHSVNYKLQSKVAVGRPLVVLDEITRGDGGSMCTRNCTLVGSLPLLLLSGEIAVAPAEDNIDDPNGEDDDEGSESDGATEDDIEFDNKPGEHCENKSCEQGEDKVMSSPDNAVRVIMDRWLYFESRALDVAQLYCLRERLSAAILHKVSHPREPLPPALEASVNAIVHILSSDGLLGMPDQFSKSGGAMASLEVPLVSAQTQTSQKKSLSLSSCRPSNGNLENHAPNSQHVSSRR
ncbi:DExH-box ATP-dependent RNA helicase DExH6-like isoform X2 [Neltuma alba]|uniref:DExH-box ATP-dependent RNA helicase DExH6-like isoform X2 n=1 Tax=Neltuma alba TaxID=207710 RepID=UPI0010A59289|nr:DExH-box ATP-dependent RNA helicase DExH6-like isoform X2 [Prosopis alba]XP_028796972.1 DExH-box ATP-dependent RNA helicase DExH6-like isoform X2 [Prosopis alba]